MMTGRLFWTLGVEGRRCAFCSDHGVGQAGAIQCIGQLRLDCKNCCSLSNASGTCLANIGIDPCRRHTCTANILVKAAARAHSSLAACRSSMAAFTSPLAWTEAPSPAWDGSPSACVHSACVDSSYWASDTGCVPVPIDMASVSSSGTAGPWKQTWSRPFGFGGNDGQPSVGASDWDGSAPASCAWARYAAEMAPMIFGIPTPRVLSILAQCVPPHGAWLREPTCRPGP